MPICGKHRGTVLENLDPQSLGRLMVTVPDVPGAGGWAMPSVPYAGMNVGFVAIPPIGANVWVEFEAGDPDMPIWSGCFWAPGELPLVDHPVDGKVIKTECVTLKWSDTPGTGGFTLSIDPPAVSSPVSLVVDAGGRIVINNGQGAEIVLDGATVNVNEGALVVD